MEGESKDVIQEEAENSKEIENENKDKFAEEDISLMDPEDGVSEEPFNTIFADKVFIGSGAEAGAWAAALASRGASEGALIISDQPHGTVPYSRSSLTDNLINPTMEAARSFNNLPFCTLQAGSSEILQLDESVEKSEEKKLEEVDESKVQNIAWYAANGIKIMTSLQLVDADLDRKKLVFEELKMSKQQEESKFDNEDNSVTVNYKQLCVGTGTKPVLIPGPGPKYGWTVDCMLSPLASDSVSPSKAFNESDTGSMVSMNERSITESETSESKEADNSMVSVSVGKLEVSAPEEYGFGSVHYLSDIGDGTKLIYALSRAEEDGQDPVFDPVVIVGGGPMALEVCSSLSTHFPDLTLLLVLPSQGVLPSIFGSTASDQEEENTEAQSSAKSNAIPGHNSGGDVKGPCEELATFYESQLVKRGIKIARGFTVSRLWLPHEEGTFSTLDGPPSNLRPTRPRPFGVAQTQFKQSRGVVLVPSPRVGCDSPPAYDADEVYVPARLVIVCDEQTPNVPTPLVKAGLRTVPVEVDASEMIVVPNTASSTLSSNALVLDSNCRTSYSDVFACGGCAAFTIQPAIKQNALTSRPSSRSVSRPNTSSSRPSTSQSRRSKSKTFDPVLLTHLTSAKNIEEMARFVPNAMVDGVPTLPPMLRKSSSYAVQAVEEGADSFTSFPYNSTDKFSPVPWLSCSMAEMRFRFAGSTLQAIPVLVGSTIGYPKFFSCIWVRDNRIVGVFLEGGQEKHSAALMTMAAQRPRIINIKKLKRVSLDKLLADPFCLEPPVLSFKGEFLAELDEEAILDALRMYDADAGGVVKTTSIGPIMTELGSDWDEDELKEAEAALDPSGRGLVSYDAFKTWWCH